MLLPSYSPGLNPIEEAFSKIRNMVRKAGERIREALDEAIAEALEAVAPEDAMGWFAHCGCHELKFMNPRLKHVGLPLGKQRTYD